MKIKSYVLITIFLSALSASAYASQVCDGFKAGYISGYKEAKNTTLAPLVPLCPLHPLKRFGDPESDFEHGYIIGLKKGMTAGYK